jgi:hypothetical protein
MTMIEDLRRRLAGPPAATAADAAAENDATRGLRAKRDELAARVAELTFDLGGLTYEMAIRDHFRPEVLVRRAARLQEADAELAEAERLLRLGESGSSGACRACGALRSRGASFCWQCGRPLLEGVSAPSG